MRNLRLAGLAALAVVCAAPTSLAQDGEADPPTQVAGDVFTAFIPNDDQRWWYEGRFHFAPVARAGDTLYLSGAIAGPGDDGPADAAAFEADLRTVFETLGQSLAAAGADWSNVVRLNTYHVFDSPAANFGKSEHMDTLARVKDDYIGEPYPAWTAIGVVELYEDSGLVEIELTAYVPDTAASPADMP